MRSSLVLATEQAQSMGELMPIGYGILAFVILISLLLITFAFRSVGTRYRNR